MLTQAAVCYALRQLAVRVGCRDIEQDGCGFKSIGVCIIYKGRAYGDASSPNRILVRDCSEQAWNDILSLGPNSLKWLPQSNVLPAGSALSFDDPIPVLFWAKNSESSTKPFAERLSDGTIAFHADIIAATFFLLSRWEETVVPVRDEHGRFPATASVAYKQGFLDRPIVDEYALILREWLKVLTPRWEPKPQTFSVKLSHDIDAIRRCPSWWRGLRTISGDLFKRRNPSLAFQTLQDLIQAPEQDSYLRGIFTLAGLSHTHGLKSAFYFMATEPSDMDSGYNVEAPLVQHVIRALQEQGFEIGLHASYYSLNDSERLAAEKARLDRVLRKMRYGGRQHYLRFRAPDTWRCWEEVGLVYDSTVGYADHEGFRCGTCHPFHPFDVELNRELSIIEYPLIVMDDTLHSYRKMNPKQGEDVILRLARRCKQVEGIFTILWHNTYLSDQHRPWGDMYQRILKRLCEMND